MFGVIAARRAAVPAARRVAQRGQVRHLRLDQPSAPNTILEQQRQMCKGSTPYLRGDADPTFLRGGQSDKAIFVFSMGAVATCWLMVGWNHYRMWNGKK